MTGTAQCLQPVIEHCGIEVARQPELDVEQSTARAARQRSARRILLPAVYTPEVHTLPYPLVFSHAHEWHGLGPCHQIEPQIGRARESLAHTSRIERVAQSISDVID